MTIAKFTLRWSPVTHTLREQLSTPMIALLALVRLLAELRELEWLSYASVDAITQTMLAALQGAISNGTRSPERIRGWKA